MERDSRPPLGVCDWPHDRQRIKEKPPRCNTSTPRWYFSSSTAVRVSSARAAELDEMWSFVGTREKARCCGMQLIITRQSVVYVVGTPEDRVLETRGLLTRGLTRYYTDKGASMRRRRLSGAVRKSGLRTIFADSAHERREAAKTPPCLCNTGEANGSQQARSLKNSVSFRCRRRTRHSGRVMNQLHATPPCPFSLVPTKLPHLIGSAARAEETRTARDEEESTSRVDVLQRGGFSLIR